MPAVRLAPSNRAPASWSWATRFWLIQSMILALGRLQPMTALDCVGELLTAPENNGLVLGAMQSGKTTTWLGLQFARLIVYLLTGRSLYPMTHITSHTSQEDQTKIEISRFLDFYGELAVVLDDKERCTLIEYARGFHIDPVFAFAPTINTYRETCAKEGTAPNTLVGPRLDDFIQRRVRGESIRRVVEICRRANSQGFSPLLIIDEPQYGASDRMVKVDDGFERRPCVLLQIFDQIKEALGADAPDRVFIGLSATPFELHDIQAVWTVRQYLTSAYVGFNYFGGKVIDQDATVSPPRTISFTDLGQEIGQRLGKCCSPHTTPTLTSSPASPRGPATRDPRSSIAERSRRHCAPRSCTWPATAHGCEMGFVFGWSITTFVPASCFRACTCPRQRSKSLNISARITVGPGASSAHSASGSTPLELPFMIAVTNRARMGDAFPREVEWFLEFSNKAANLNALLQGLLGRACGYDKRSTVVMSEEERAFGRGL